MKYSPNPAISIFQQWTLSKTISPAPRQQSSFLCCGLTQQQHKTFWVSKHFYAVNLKCLLWFGLQLLRDCLMYTNKPKKKPKPNRTKTFLQPLLMKNLYFGYLFVVCGAFDCPEKASHKSESWNIKLKRFSRFFWEYAGMEKLNTNSSHLNIINLEKFFEISFNCFDKTESTQSKSH